MDRCHLKGEMGDRLHAVLCAAGCNIRWLLRAIARKGLRAVLRLLPNGVASELMRVLGKVKALMAPAAASRLAVSG